MIGQVTFIIDQVTVARLCFHFHHYFIFLYMVKEAAESSHSDLTNHEYLIEARQRRHDKLLPNRSERENKPKWSNHEKRTP